MLHPEPAHRPSSTELLDNALLRSKKEQVSKRRIYKNFDTLLSISIYNSFLCLFFYLFLEIGTYKGQGEALTTRISGRKNKICSIRIGGPEISIN